MLHRRRGDLATIARKAFFKNLELRLVGEAPPPPRIDDRQPAHRCPKTVLMPVHKDKTTDSHHALKAAAVGCLRCSPSIARDLLAGQRLPVSHRGPVPRADPLLSARHNRNPQREARPATCCRQFPACDWSNRACRRCWSAKKLDPTFFNLRMGHGCPILKLNRRALKSEKGKMQCTA